ncbi:hypothetical protein [Microbulbifer sp. ALW1]|uniref:hypothetical protein n=1 Tax=Microbulbifer sp. (strain ALW1) TaxID=1516059 RepID=UPI001359FF96|nr:hypothetical protein [Microbulbifer sp. ALW1]
MNGAGWRHLGIELSVSISQTAIFFFLALFSTNFLRDKEALQAFMERTVSTATFPQFWLTILSIFVVSGFLFALIQAFRNNAYVELIALQVLLEIPRVISIFGSSVFALMLAISIHLWFFPEENEPFASKFIVLGLLFWSASFIYSFALRLIFRRDQSPVAPVHASS